MKHIHADPKAFSDAKYKYYELQYDIPCVHAGAIFYWDKKDYLHGSVGEGCLKLCWTPEGNCYGNTHGSVCAGTIIFHASARKDNSWFKRIK